MEEGELKKAITEQDKITAELRGFGEFLVKLPEAEEEIRASRQQELNRAGSEEEKSAIREQHEI